MPDTPSRSHGAARGVGLLVVTLLAALAIFALVQRKRYPDGTFLHQQRTYLAENVNPDLAEVVPALVPGETEVRELEARLGEPTARVEEDGLELWVYTSRKLEVTERRLLGVVPTGSSSSGFTSQMPVGVRDGVVVHTFVTPSDDAATREAIERMWDAWSSGR